MVFEKNLSFKKIDLEIPITSFQKIEWFHYGCTLFSRALVLHISYLTATIQLTIFNRLGTRLAYALSQPFHSLFIAFLQPLYSRLMASYSPRIISIIFWCCSRVAYLCACGVLTYFGMGRRGKFYASCESLLQS